MCRFRTTKVSKISTEEAMMSEDFPLERIERRIYLIRGHKAMLDSDLAQLYGVRVKVLNQSVRRHLKRFPGDFMFQLTGDESRSLRSQIVTSKKGRGGRRYIPFVFTEQGVAMLSSVLHSERAIAVNILIMRAFVRFREMIASHKEIAAKLLEVEKRVNSHDVRIRSITDVIQKLMAPPVKKIRKIGFK